jgi:hypothetical protein
LGFHIRQQILAQNDQPNPITFTTPDGKKGRVWLSAAGIGDDRHWRVHVRGAAQADRDELNRLRAERRRSISNAYRLETEPLLKGFTVRLGFEDEVPAIGSGLRTVLVQFRGKKVILHHASYTATIKRDAFKALVAASKRYRKRNRHVPTLRLVVNNGPAFDAMTKAA